MNVRRGDVVLAWYPFASGQGGKRRPCLVVQNDMDNAKVANTIVAQITSNFTRVADKSHLLIESTSPERGAATCRTFTYRLRPDSNSPARSGASYTARSASGMAGELTATARACWSV
jgi:hypothetical protein